MMKIQRYVFSPIEVNTYILYDSTGECAIVDCGCYSEREFLKLVRFIESKELKPVLLLNTHCHLDHIFGNKLVLEKYGIRSTCDELEEPNRMNAQVHASFFGLSMETPPQPGTFIKDGHAVTFGSSSLKAIAVPGHSSGSLAFYSKADQMVLTGDALFAGSIGRTDLPGGDYQTLIDSIKNKLLTLPGSTVVYPGHGPETTIDRESRSNPFLSEE
jgi:hydroxyacylglutathione hydrolase